jgi:hypothetical protein
MEHPIAQKLPEPQEEGDAQNKESLTKSGNWKY